MRVVLVDWIIDVHHKLNLLPETLYLSVNLIDRFLSVRVVSIGKLQLVGVSGLLVASKFHEVVSPSVETFVVLTDRSFTEGEILRAEKYLLHCLEYRIHCPSPFNWINLCLPSSEALKLGMVIMDLSLLDESFLIYKPSVLGCSIAYLSQQLVEAKEEEIFNHFSPYSLKELRTCINSLKNLLSPPVSQESIFKKHGVFFVKYLENVERRSTWKEKE